MAHVDAAAFSRRDVVVRDPRGRVAFEAADVEVPRQWSDVAAATVAARWLLAGERFVRDMVRRVVGTLGAWAQVSGHAASDADRRQFEDALARLVLAQRATFATPVWMNIGTAERPVTAACFILAVEDSLPALLEWNAQEGRIFSKAGEEARGRALVSAGFDPGEVVRGLAFQQENHSVRVTDAFMQAARTGKGWPLRAVTTGRTTATVAARDILRACAQAAWECGDPGLQFASSIDRWQTCPAAGPVTASSPCGEFVSVAHSACNLATINALAYVTEDGGFDVYGFTAAVDALVRALDVLLRTSRWSPPSSRSSAAASPPPSTCPSTPPSTMSRTSSWTPGRPA